MIIIDAEFTLKRQTNFFYVNYNELNYFILF